MAEPRSNSRRALLLQGPIGPFFKTLLRVLEEHGYQAHQVAFNTGDLINASWRNTTSYNKGRKNWRRWLRELLTKQSITVVVLFGCERFHHQVARSVCAEMGIPVLSLEEGYVRPGYIVAEWGGNNWLSPVANLPAEEIRTAKAPATKAEKPGKNFGKMVWLGFLYYNIRALGRPYFSRAMYHKTRPVVPEALKWIRNYYRWLTRKKRNLEIVKRLVGPLKGKFFFIPLQVSDDQQLTASGEGWTNGRLIREAIDSFLQHAPQDAVLVFKLHPMERGHSNDVLRIEKIARNRKAADRIIAIDDGPLSELVRASRGMMTINSTSGMSALYHNIPLAVLGKAIFRRSDLATCINTMDDMHNFWIDAKACEPDLAEGFRNSLFSTALLPGDYYLKAHRRAAAEAIVKKLSSI